MDRAISSATAWIAIREGDYMRNVVLRLTLLCTLVICFGCGRESDAGLTRRIEGTWAGTESTPDGLVLRGETTYLPGGRMNLRGSILYGEATHPIIGSGTWQVRDGYLHYTLETSNVSDFLPDGYSSADQILKVTDTELIYRSSGSGKTKVEQRVR